MLTVHHLGVSQSERVVWLCEELGIPYELKIYKRAPVMAPPDYKALHPIGSAPVIQDDTADGGRLTLAESGAVIDWIIAKHGNGRFALTKDHPDFAQYLYWFHFANGTLQPAIMRVLIGSRVDPEGKHPASRIGRDRMALCLGLLEARLGSVPWLAGAEFSAADIMTVFCLTTMRHYLPYDLAPYPQIRSYLARIGERPAYRRAMEKGDPGMELKLA
jgi:glutathione S-transferase